jgi:hypothetical protein
MVSEYSKADLREIQNQELGVVRGQADHDEKVHCWRRKYETEIYEGSCNRKAARISVLTMLIIRQRASLVCWERALGRAVLNCGCGGKRSLETLEDGANDYLA